MQMQPLDPEAVSLVLLSMSHRNKIRQILSRKESQSFEIMGSISPGELTNGCMVCCQSPACCPLCAVCPCCADAEYVTISRKASAYIYIRENSLEWNEPVVVMKPGLCFGVDPCMYDIQDNVRTIYFDDIMFDRITDQTRTCNECRTCICGGRGERVRIDSPICCSICQRSAFPCPCVPICCPKSFCPCILRHEIYMEDAQKGLYEIKKARNHRMGLVV
jgi:hypothetical protein